MTGGIKIEEKPANDMVGMFGRIDDREGELHTFILVCDASLADMTFKKERVSVSYF